MREARFVLDAIRHHSELWTRGGKTMEQVGECVCRAFGGFTSQPVLGGWCPPEALGKGRSDHGVILDRGVEFRVGMPNGSTQEQLADWHRLLNLVNLIAAGQETVYTVSPWGDANVTPVFQPHGITFDKEMQPAVDYWLSIREPAVAD